MSKKKISVTVTEELDAQLNRKVQQLGVSKSAFVAFAASFFLHQLNTLERTSDGNNEIYQLIRQNFEDASEL